MIVTLGETAHFVIQYQDSFKDGLRRAEALRSSAESLFGHYQWMFGVSGGFGVSVTPPLNNKVTLLVEQASLASNNGYRTDGKMLIKMHPFDGDPDPGLADDAVLALFVAEIVEVLMAYRQYSTGVEQWHESWSDGEGLSRVLAALAYPAPYYSGRLLQGPFVNEWLGSDTRKDWISDPEKTDMGRESYGCSILFLYYLKDQLGQDLRSIVTKAGATLEGTYKALTGQSGGYAAFTQVLERYFPKGKTPQLPTDNPFPLLEGNQRSVWITFAQKAQRKPAPAESGVVTIQPFVNCPADVYSWTTSNISQRVLARAVVEGFGQPRYTWRLNGVILDGGGNVEVQATVLRDDPAAPGKPRQSTETVKLYYSKVANASTYQETASELYLSNQDYPGHVELSLSADVRETYASEEVSTGSGITRLDAQVLRYENRYYTDRESCAKQFEKAISQFVHYRWIPIVLTLPDPAPELVNGVRVLVELGAELQRLYGEEPNLATEVARALSQALGVSEQLLTTAGGEGKGLTG